MNYLELNSENVNQKDIQYDIKLKLINKNCKETKILNFEYSKFLKSYLVIFKKRGSIRKNYKVNFIVNGNIVIDPRFKLDIDEDGKFYNIIESHWLLIKNKIKSYENKLKYMSYLTKSNNDNTNNVSKDINIIRNKEKSNSFKMNNQETSKYWEDIFKIKIINNCKSLNTNSVSDASEIPDIDKVFLKKNIEKKNYKEKEKIISLRKSRDYIKPFLKKQSSERYAFEKIC